MAGYNCGAVGTKSLKPESYKINTMLQYLYN